MRLVDSGYDDHSLTPVLELPVVGTLRPGATPKAYSSRDVLSLLYIYFVVGFLFEALPALTQPVFATYFGLSHPDVGLVGGVLFVMATSKVLIGVLSDCFPLFGYRRKTWIVFAAVGLTAFFVTLASLPHDPPYTPHLIPQVSKDEGHRAVLLCACAAFFLVLANVPADALMVEMAQREASVVRGRLLSLVYAVRYMGTTMAQLVAEASLASTAFGGDYSFALGLPAYFGILACLSAIVVPVVLVWFTHEPRRGSVNCPEYLGEFWSVVQTRAMWQILLFAFLFNACGVLTATMDHPTVLTWAHVTPTMRKWANIAGGLGMPLGFLVAGWRGTEWNWRVAVVASTVAFASLKALAGVATACHVIDSPTLFLVLDEGARVPLAIAFIVTTYNYIEGTPPGKEGITYGMLSSLHNVSYGTLPLVGMAIIDRLLPPKSADRTDDDDTTEMRRAVATIYLLGLAWALVSCVCVFLLPQHKHHVKFLKGYGGQQPIAAMLTLLLCVGSIVAAITLTVLALLPSSVL
ncbi:Aste57867_18310 [Aphanomyces stellatus]|uniref:Aste57867_18310 protein n=1 Tax=Aphanomyces stellatus TaxID=120398 RepID=A0A485L9Q8_9STRA|nr:hypothetical protein As57867_018248 [Aphanomyces stellatus]VFT95046.1 Aste57867_18310 [Aphanomyces stellatus]